MRIGSQIFWPIDLPVAVGLNVLKLKVFAWMVIMERVICFQPLVKLLIFVLTEVVVSVIIYLQL